MNGGKQQKARGVMKKALFILALFGLVTLGQEAKAMSVQSIDNNPVINEGVIAPCMPCIFGMTNISIMKNFMLKNLQR